MQIKALIYLKMARTHARRKGKSGSKMPINANLDFVKLSEKEIIELIVKMAKDDVKASIIGLILRDTYSIASVKKIVGKTLTQILFENGLAKPIPDDLQCLIDKAKGLQKHLEKNTRDVHNRRGFQLIDSKIRRLAKYYKLKGKMPKNWSYNLKWQK